MKRILAFYGMFFGFFVMAQTEFSQTVEAQIINQKSDDYITMQAQATNLSSLYLDLNYTFLALRRDEKGNISSNKQGGKFTLGPEESKNISQIKVNLQGDDNIKAYLFIRNEGDNTVLAKDSLLLGKLMKAKKQNPQQIEEELQTNLISGLVVEETKTRPGRDFYDMFFMKYQLLPKKFPFIIKITEVPIQRRTTKLTIYADDQEVNSFVANPNVDYLEQRANQSMALLRRYAVKQNLMEKELSQ